MFFRLLSFWDSIQLVAKPPLSTSAWLTPRHQVRVVPVINFLDCRTICKNRTPWGSTVFYTDQWHSEFVRYNLFIEAAIAFSCDENGALWWPGIAPQPEVPRFGAQMILVLSLPFLGCSCTCTSCITKVSSLEE